MKSLRFGLLRGLTVLSLGILGAACGREEFLFLAPPEKAGPLAIPDRVATQIDLTDFGSEDKGVDILWVIDNSGSMAVPQAQVIANASHFIDAFSKTKLDWKMGLISTSYLESPLLGLAPGDEFTFRDPLPVQRFMDAVQRLGTLGDAEERPFLSIATNLERFPEFKRKGHALTLILVTDAEEQSRMSGEDFMKKLQSLVPPKTSVFGYGVFNSTNFGCDGESGSLWSYVGSPFEAFFKLTRKHTVFGMCGADYGASLAQLGKDIVKVVGKPIVRLQYTPQPNTVRVFHEGRELPGGPKEWGGYWLYDASSNAVHFHSLEFTKGRSKDVLIKYEVLK